MAHCTRVYRGRTSGSLKREAFRNAGRRKKRQFWYAVGYFEDLMRNAAEELYHATVSENASAQLSTEETHPTAAMNMSVEVVFEQLSLGDSSRNQVRVLLQVRDAG